MAVRLSDCREGDRAVIVFIHGNDVFRNRLREMGFLRGTELEIVRYAPLRDPLALCVKDYCVSLRVEEAMNIEVEICDHPRRHQHGNGHGHRLSGKRFGNRRHSHE